MPKMIQIRNVPDEVHRRLKARAAQRRMTLSDYLNIELLHIAQTPTLEEVVERIRQQEPVQLDESIVDVIRAHRDS